MYYILGFEPIVLFLFLFSSRLGILLFSFIKLLPFVLIFLPPQLAFFAISGG